MDSSTRAIVRQQFGAALDMLENAIRQCPEPLWSDRSQRPEFWYVAYHSLFWLDLYLHGSIEGFAPPAPFNLDELDPAGLIPERPYTKHDLLGYLEHGRRRFEATIEALTGEKARATRWYGWGHASFAELLLYNMRHVQHHAAQLNLILRQKTDSAPGWVPQAQHDAA
jgi:hypothetical protein